MDTRPMLATECPVVGSGVARRARKPAVPVPTRLARSEPGVGPLRVRGLLAHSGTAADRGLVHGVCAPVRARRAVARTYREDEARGVAVADDHVVRASGAMHEIPLPKRALLALDDEQRLAGEHEEVLLVVLPVVHRHRLPRSQPGEVDPELVKVQRVLQPEALELAEHAAAVADPPRRIPCIEAEPP